MEVTELLFLLLLLAVVGIAIYFYRYNSAQQKGMRGEKRINDVLASLPNDYHVLNDLVFKTEKGTTQIDHIVVSKYGVFAIETKNYRGEIYGDDNRQEWTQMIITKVQYKTFGKTYTYVTKNHFYNPVKQSIGHVYGLKKILTEWPYLKIVPIVVFTGSAILCDVESKHDVVYDYNLINTIKKYNTEYISDADVQRVLDVIQAKNVKELVTNRTHVKNIKAARKEAYDKMNAGICPKCGGKLIERKGKYGAFYGCSNYPKCKFTM